MPYYPWRFGVNSWYQKLSFMSPLWGLADEVTMARISKEWPEARTRIYYQVYERSAGMSDHTTAILDRAKQDVEHSCMLMKS